MPKITLKYEGEVNTLDISDKDTNRLGIEKLIQEEWKLKFGQYSLNYVDQDGDEITSEIDEDFEVAKLTMIEKQDLLVFNLTLKEGFKPQFKLIKIESQRSQKEPKQFVIEPQSLITEKVVVKAVKIEEVKPIKPIPQAQEIIQETQKIQKLSEPKEEKKKDKSAKKKDQKPKPKKQSPPVTERKQEQQPKKQVQKEQKLEQKKKPQKKQVKKQQQKKQVEIPRTTSSQVVQQSPKKQEEVKEKEEKKPVPPKVKPAPKPAPKKEQPTLTKKQIVALIKSEVFDLLPELKKELGLVEEQKKMIEGQKCGNCPQQLSIPFYYEVDSKVYICEACEKKDQNSILVKVKDPSFLEEAAFINFNVVKKEEMKVEKVNEEKYLEEARGIILQKIKETYTAKIMEVKKRKQEQQQKKKQEELKKKQEEQKRKLQEKKKQEELKKKQEQQKKKLEEKKKKEKQVTQVKQEQEQKQEQIE